VLPVKGCGQGHKQLCGRVGGGGGGGGNSDAQRVSCDRRASKQAISYVAEKSTPGTVITLTVPHLEATVKAKDNFLLHLQSRKIVADYSFLKRQKSLCISLR